MNFSNYIAVLEHELLTTYFQQLLFVENPKIFESDNGREVVYSCSYIKGFGFSTILCFSLGASLLTMFFTKSCTDKTTEAAWIALVFAAVAVMMDWANRKEPTRTLFFRVHDGVFLGHTKTEAKERYNLCSEDIACLVEILPDE
jgi:hypothetical protein